MTYVELQIMMLKSMPGIAKQTQLLSKYRTKAGPCLLATGVKEQRRALTGSDILVTC